jgi:hypothetical protein
LNREDRKEFDVEKIDQLPDVELIRKRDGVSYSKIVREYRKTQVDKSSKKANASDLLEEKIREEQEKDRDDDEEVCEISIRILHLSSLLPSTLSPPANDRRAHSKRERKKMTKRAGCSQESSCQEEERQEERGRGIRKEGQEEEGR